MRYEATFANADWDDWAILGCAFINFAISVALLVGILTGNVIFQIV